MLCLLVPNLKYHSSSLHSVIYSIQQHFICSFGLNGTCSDSPCGILPLKLRTVSTSQTKKWVTKLKWYLKNTQGYHYNFKLLTLPTVPSAPIWQLSFEVALRFKISLVFKAPTSSDLIARTPRNLQHISRVIFMCKLKFPVNQIGWKEYVWDIGLLMNL